MLVAGVPGTPTSTGMTAGTRTPLNVSLDLPFTFGLGTYGEMLPVVKSMSEPMEIGPGEGMELVLLLSTADARFLRPKSARPHRIFVWDEVCKRWQYAGKFELHQRMVHKEVK